MRRQATSHALASVPGRATRSGTSALVVGFETGDSRSDNGKRVVEVRGDGIAYERRVACVQMRLFVPAVCYDGVALAVQREKVGTGLSVSVTLIHQDSDLDVVLFEADDDNNVTAEWQYWAQHFGLPMLVAEPDGSFTAPFPRLGALMVEGPRGRRRPADFAARRPRFLTRRRTGTVLAAPQVHREREIIAPE